MEEEARACFRDEAVTSVVIVGPTGSGKTQIALSIISKSIAKGKRVYFINHRREILGQSVIALQDLPIGIVAAGFPENSNAPVQVCSLQTLINRHAKMLPPDLIVWDEVHHIGSKTWSQLYAAYPNAKHIGLTATPIRTDRIPLGKWFQRMVVGPTTGQLIEMGFLSPYRIFAPVRVDLSGIHTVAGDYNKHELTERMKTTSVCGDAVSHYLKHGKNERAIIFMWSIDSSIDMAKRFNEAGVPAAHIDGGTDKQTRDRAIQMFREGEIRCLTQVSICEEGFDLPLCQIGYFCRPTQSLTVWLQQLGRVLRPAPGKIATLVDMASNSYRLGLPDDPREWNLSDGDGARKKKKDDEEQKVRICPKCTETYPMSVRVCRCGYVLVQAREMEVDEDAELAEIDPVQLRRQRMADQSKADDFDKLVKLGRTRGYRFPESWAKHLLASREEKKLKRQVPLVVTERPELVTAGVDERWLF